MDITPVIQSQWSGCVPLASGDLLADAQDSLLRFVAPQAFAGA
eukprot:CAMPEP_0204646886 /NCGR_PEP_ID=MMETSP0718-20130828/5235_1 /ASSEMBLY_ACC=CAM_ASM_000674 /TAXON_ID=230516 /ORGANISM="Chaetoceros curvisetus" /LENGTH=42 /DNA_ID= /DNA_START= /DNA_END= /DNA_ORIENTATION=